MKIKSFLLLTVIPFFIISCGIYSFTGGDVGDAKTIQINFFNNNAQLIEPTLSQSFTLALQDFFLQQTNLDLTKKNGDLQFEGEITRYTIIPTNATANQTAAQNRLTVEVNVRYFNQKEPKKDFEKRFSHFFDFDANAILQDALLEEAYEVIFERITQDIFNASVANW